MVIICRVEGVFYRIIQYLNLFNVEPVQIKVQDTLARGREMRKSYRSKIKRLKEQCSCCGLFPGILSSSNSTDDICGNMFMLQDLVADLKRMIADTVFCFNLE